MSHAYVDAGRHPDLRAGLEAAIGRVSHFEVMEPASISPASAPAVQRRTGVIVDAGPAPALFELAAFFAERVAAHPPVEVPTGFRLPKRSARVFALDIPFLEAPCPPPPPCGAPELRLVAPPAPAADRSRVTTRCSATSWIPSSRKTGSRRSGDGCGPRRPPAARQTRFQPSGLCFDDGRFRFHATAPGWG